MKGAVRLFVLSMLVLLLFAGQAFAGDQVRLQDPVQDRLHDGSGTNCPSLLSLYLGTNVLDTAVSILADQDRDRLQDGSCVDGTDPLDKPLRDRDQLKDGSCQDVPDDSVTIAATVTQEQSRDRVHDKTQAQTKDRTQISRPDK